MRGGIFGPTGRRAAGAVAACVLLVLAWVLAHGLIFSFAEAHLWTR